MDSDAYVGVLIPPAFDAVVGTAGTQGSVIGYALVCLMGAAAAVLIVARVAERIWPGWCDPRPASADGITTTSVYLLQRVALGEMKAFKRGRICILYLERDGETQVVAPDKGLLPRDKAVIARTPAAAEPAMHDLDIGLHDCLAKGRTAADFRRLTISPTRTAGRIIARVDMSGCFQGVITYVKHSDLDLLARRNLVLEPGDRVLAVIPNDEPEKAVSWFDDSERSVAQIDAFSVGVGMALGVLLGLVAIPLLGGITLRPGVAVGPFVADMVLGRTGRTRPFVWGLPHAVNSTIRQLGLLFLLVAIGLASGPDFAASVSSVTGFKVGVLVAFIVAVNAVVLLAEARQVGMSTQRASGGLARPIGQPVIFALALSKRDDERTEARYTTLPALAIVAKIAMVQILVTLQARNLMAVGGGTSPGRRT